MQNSKLQYKIKNYDIFRSISEKILTLLTFKFKLLTCEGQSLVELLITIGLTSIVLPILFFGLISSTNSKAQETQSLGASSLLKEGMEAARSAREASWTNVATVGTYYVLVTSGVWQLTATVQPAINGFTRTVIISSVQRDASGNIVVSGGTVDPSTKKITVNVAWNTPYSSSVSSTLYLSRYLNNQAILQPSPAPPAVLFTTYTSANSSGVIVNNANVKLSDAGAGKGDWCAATPKVVGNLASGEIISAMWGTVLGTTPPTNRVYFGTGGEQYDVDVYNVVVTDPQVPNPVPVPTLGGRSTTGYQTNDIFGEPNFAYIASNNSTTKHVVIYNTTNSTITEVGSVNLGTTNKATGVFVVGNTGYAVAANKLYTFDLTSRSGTKTPLNNFTLLGNAKKVYVVNAGSQTLAFVAINATTNQLQMVDVTNRAAMVAAGSLTVAGQAGQDVFASPDGLRAYLVTAQSATQAEFFIINTTNAFTHTTIPAPIGSYNLGANAMSPRAVKMVLSKNRAIIVGTGGTEQYVVLDIGNENVPVRCSGMAVSGGSAFAVSPILEVDGDAYAYIATNDQSKQLQIVEGGPGTQYASVGTYESTAFDALNSVSFNRFQATYDLPAGTTVSFQVGAAPAVSGSCSGAVFTFQNLSNITTSTVGTVVSLNGVIPYPNNQGRCFKYRATMTPTSDFKFTPTLQTTTINYTP